MKYLSIVIVTWNCKKFAQECLDSVTALRQDARTEVIVVDNASTDGTPELIQNSYPDVILVQSGENLGFPRGTNVGIRRASGQFLCLINPDVKVLDGSIETMLKYLEGNSRVGLLGPRMLSPDGTSCRSYMGAPNLWNLLCRALALDTIFPGNKLFGGFLMFYFDRSKVAEVDVLNGWFWVTRREAVQEVGLLDEALFMYADDLDWSKRFRDAGWKVVYFPGAESIHYGGGTTARAPIRFSIEMQRANFQYWCKNYGKLSQGAYLVVTALHHSLRVVGYSLRWLSHWSDVKESRFKVKRSWACLQWALGVGGSRGRVTLQTVVQPENTVSR
jgi:GT2 family glycosyltransferase